MTLLDEITLKVPPALLATRDTQAITDALNVGRTSVQEHWLTDRGLASDLINATGNMDLSDSILTKLDALATSSRTTQAMVNRLTTDAKGVNFGDAALLAQWLYLESVGVITAVERDALLALPVKADLVSEFEVRVALYHPLTGDYLA